MALVIFTTNICVGFTLLSLYEDIISPQTFCFNAVDVDDCDNRSIIQYYRASTCGSCIRTGR